MRVRKGSGSQSPWRLRVARRDITTPVMPDQVRHRGPGASVTVLVSVAFACVLALAACSPAATPALATLPAEPDAAVTPVATPPRVTALLVSHPVEGREECSLCHGDEGIEPLPDDHDGRGDGICLGCHDVQPAPTPPLAGSEIEQGQVLWQERQGLACRNCHGLSGEGGFGPALAGTSLDLETFSSRTRSPLSDRMPPVGSSLDDPAFEASGIWISDGDLGLVYAWLTASR